MHSSLNKGKLTISRIDSDVGTSILVEGLHCLETARWLRVLLGVHASVVVERTGLRPPERNHFGFYPRPKMLAYP